MSNREKIRKEAMKLNPIDDIMFRKMAENIDFCQEILQVILDDSKLVVLETMPQWNGTNLQGRSVILDAKCISSDGEQINIEVQRADDDDHQRRVRYNGAILTTNITEPGTKFKNVPNVTIVYISKFDIYKGSRPLYHVDRVVRETNEVVDNGFKEIYVNSKINDGSDIADLMQIFVNDDKYDNKFPVTSKTKKLFKETKGGIRTMCEIMERIAAEERREGKLEGILEGKQQGILEGQLNMLFNLVHDGIISMEEAARRAEMSENAFSEMMNQFNK